MEKKDNNQNDSPEQLALAKLQSELLQFASLINHDFKEPIRTISAFSTLLEKRIGAEDEKSRELLHFIQDGASRMGDMVEALVEYLRVERYTDEKRNVSLHELLNDVLFSLKKEKQRATIQLPKQDVVVFGSSNSLHQLFKHILKNALIFHGNEKPSIIIQAANGVSEVKIWVSDNGIGVPTEMLDSIFQPFRRLNAIGTYKGCGLGLATAKKVVDMHGGKIRAEKNQHNGLTVLISLPNAKN